MFSWLLKILQLFFLHILVLELLFNKTNIDVMMLFKFDFNHAVLNLASMKFSFDLNLFFFFYKGTVFCSSEMSKKVTKKTWKNFSFTSLDRSRISFDWSNRNREPIDSGKDFVMNFFKFSINREFLLIDRKRIENRSSHLETSWWISLVFQLIKKYFRPINRTVFEISLSVKTLMSEKPCVMRLHMFSK